MAKTLFDLPASQIEAGDVLVDGADEVLVFQKKVVKGKVSLFNRGNDDVPFATYGVEDMLTINLSAGVPAK